MIPLKNNPDCYIVNVPGDATEIQDTKANGIMWKMPDGSYDSLYFDDVIPQSSLIEIIGEISADHIGFDVEPFVKRIAVGIFQNYNHESPYMNHHCKNANDSFYSLLEASGVYFKNPYGESEPIKPWQDSIMEEGLHQKYKLKMEQWQTCQNQLTQKSILIKKV